ncbi:MAG: N-acetylmuramoyl-L-alanine amidase [Sulfuricurvum sp.]|nr:N-acetylmuramoyl-L-alanine amidase [Sulfuricurvum sp.]MDD5386703.1 N-acetylmuramoyl-L-alanine amidase [Sulfuricurvum sp.]
MLGRITFLLLLSLSVLLGAADDSTRLESAKKALSSNDEIEQFRGYNEYKSLYLRAAQTKNSVMEKEALEGIVKGGELLRIDVSKYKSELARLSPPVVSEPASPLPVAIAPTIVKPQEAAPKALVFPKEYLKTSLPFPSTPAPAVNFLTLTKEELIKKPEILRTASEADLLKRHRLVEAQWKDTGIELTFDTKVDANEIHLSKIIESDKQRFRYIIDIDGGTLSQTKILEHSPIQKIRLAQYDAKTLRVVIEYNEAISIKPIINAQSVYIDLALPSVKGTTLPALATLIVQPPARVQEPPLVAALPPLLNVTPRDRSKKVIVIDPGHGGKDSGATGNGYMEKDIVLQVGLQLAEQLRSIGYTVYLTRSNDTFIELKDRTKFANDKLADLFLSVHANAIPKGSDANAAYGIETYFLSPGRSERAMRVAALENSEDMSEMGAYGKLSFLSVLNSEKIIASNKLAIDIQKGVLNNLRKQYPNIKDNGAREAPFWVLVGAQMPAILLETGYISNPEECSRIADPKYQKWMVEGMMDGVKHYFANNP